MDTLQFAREHIMEDEKIVLISGDDYLYNCTDYYIPQADIYYTTAFDPGQLATEEGLTEFWFFDNGDYFDLDELKRAGLWAEDFGAYQFGYIHINIYKISQ